MGNTIHGTDCNRPVRGRRALITGITGQDGAYLAEFLLAKGYQHVEKFLPTSEPKIDIAVILAVINSEKIMHSSENFFKEFDYVRTRMLLFWLYIRRY